MNLANWKRVLAGLWSGCLLLAISCNAYGDVVSILDVNSDVILNGSDGNSSAYYEWTIDGNSAATNANFIVGSTGIRYNRLTIDSGQTLDVGGLFRIGTGSIMYYSTHNRVDVSGTLNVAGNLDISNGYNATENTLSILAGGVVFADDLELYYHWTYGNNWLELNGGTLALSGDQTASFAENQQILSSIKIWDAAANEYQRVGTYAYTSFVLSQEYYDMLSVNFIDDEQAAASLGLSTDFVGMTLVRNMPASTPNPVPLPSTMFLFWAGLVMLFGTRRKRNAPSSI